MAVYAALFHYALWPSAFGNDQSLPLTARTKIQSCQTGCSFAVSVKPTLAVIANDNVTPRVAPGEIHAVVGKKSPRKYVDEDHLRHRAAR